MLIVTYKSYDGNWQEIDFSNTMSNRKKLVNDKDFRDVYDEDSKVWLKKDFVAIDNPYGKGELTMGKAKEWSEYIDYLVQWANDHADEAFYGQSPVCFDEWYCCENEEE